MHFYKNEVLFTNLNNGFISINPLKNLVYVSHKLVAYNAPSECPTINLGVLG
jgi:hypothetical protein